MGIWNKKKKQKLKNLQVNEVSLVDVPANQEAKVILTKVDDESRLNSLMQGETSASDKELIKEILKGENKMSEDNNDKKQNDDGSVTLSKEDHESIMKTVEAYNLEQEIKKVGDKFSGREKVFFDNLSDEDKREFVSFTEDERKARMGKSFQSEDLEKAAGKIAAEEIAKAQTEASEAKELAKAATEKLSVIEFGKKADDLIPNLSGSLEERGQLLKSVENLDDKSKEIVLKALTDTNKSLGDAMKETGSNGGDATNSANEKLNDLAKQYAKDSKESITFEKAYAHIVKTPEGSELYNQI